MADFSHLKKKRTDTAEYKFLGIVGEPTFVVKFAGETNKPYFNEVLRRQEYLQKRRAKVTTQLLADNRERDRVLYPKYVVTGWKDVVDAKGAQVPFSQSECESWMKACDDDEIDGLREFCRDLANFGETGDGSDAAGNSPTA